MQAENLDADIRTLRIGKSAAALFDEDIARFSALTSGTAKTAGAGSEPDSAPGLRSLEQLSDHDWERASKEFFERAN